MDSSLKTGAAVADIQYGIKLTNRVLRCEHPMIKKRIDKLAGIEYELLVHKCEYFDKSKPILTIILTIHDGNKSYVAKSLESVFLQTYHNTEVVLINNGADGAVGELIREAFLDNKNAKLIRVTQNLFNPAANNLDDPIPNLWNAGLFCSVGNFVYFLAYDDFLSADYAERMVALFEFNEKCNTASPLVVSVNDSGDINPRSTENLKSGNKRGKYTEGVLLAKNFMRGGEMITFPGGLLASRSDLLLSCGGFDKMSDLSQLFKIGIHGESGFDPEAKLYWRHHSDQTNKVQLKMGVVYFRNYKEFMEDYGIKLLHQEVAGNEFAEEFVSYFIKRSEQEAIEAFCQAYRFGLGPGLKALRIIFLDCPPRIKAMAVLYCFIGFPAYLYCNYFPVAAKLIYRRLRNI